MRARQTRVVTVAACMAAVALAGCIDGYDDFESFDPDEHYLNPGVFPGSYLQGSGGSLPLERGLLRAPLYPDVYRLESNLPAYSEASPAVGSALGEASRVNITLAVWRPDNYTEKMPIIVDAGPYYEQGNSTIERPDQSTPLLLQNMLPRGYAVVQLAVRGTGTSGGCMDLMGPAEQHDLDQALTWLASQEWSNGNIGMIGVSYDGSTPWVAAATGNPALKTIVPISGLPDFYDLMFRNGSAETRGALMHGLGVYWAYGFGKDFPTPDAPLGSANGRTMPQNLQNLLCPEAYEGQTMGQYASADGGRGAALSSYWAERDYRQRVIDNYNGSVFLIHGLQDWNVDPHAAIPYNVRLHEAGLDVKEWYGQWDHVWPDSRCVGTTPSWAVMPCRLDFGEVLARWFDKHLLGNTTVDTGPAIQVQDNLGFWRNADSYPPAAPAWASFGLGADGSLGEGADSGTVTLRPPQAGVYDYVEFATQPFANGTHISGMPRLQVPFSVEGQGGHLAAWLFDQAPNGDVRAPMVVERPRAQDENQTEWVPGGVPVIGHAQMNLRYYPGGEEAQVLAPGTEYVAQIEFEPLEVHVPEGHRLVLWIFQYHYPDHQDSTTPGRVTIRLGENARLLLPTVDLDPRTVFPVPSVMFPNTTYIPEMYVRLPALENGQRAQPTPHGVSDVAGGLLPTQADPRASARDAHRATTAYTATDGPGRAPAVGQADTDRRNEAATVNTVDAASDATDAQADLTGTTRDGAAKVSGRCTALVGGCLP